MTATATTSTRTTTTRVTITHACGHKRRVSLHSVGAAQKSTEMFDLATRDCPTCADELAPRRAVKTEAKSEQNSASEATQATQATQAKQRLDWLKREASDVEANIASLTHTAVQMGEASAWQDARLPQIDETIHYWRGRYLALTRQISAQGAQVARLVAAAATC